jgi:hypothetical protein
MTGLLLTVFELKCLTKTIIMTKTELPAVKKGDLIILLACRNGNKNFEGKTLVVTSNRVRATKTVFNAKIVDEPEKGAIQLYYDGPGDDFILATNEAVVANLEARKVDLKKEMEDIDREITFRTKYDSEEEFVADKLDTLITTAQGGGNKEDRVKLMTDILKELKTSNVL